MKLLRETWGGFQAQQNKKTSADIHCIWREEGRKEGGREGGKEGRKENRSEDGRMDVYWACSDQHALLLSSLKRFLSRRTTADPRPPVQLWTHWFYWSVFYSGVASEKHQRHQRRRPLTRGSAVPLTLHGSEDAERIKHGRRVSSWGFYSRMMKTWRQKSHSPNRTRTCSDRLPDLSQNRSEASADQPASSQTHIWLENKRFPASRSREWRSKSTFQCLKTFSDTWIYS